ncbi:modification methylase [Microcystis phage vB_MweS-yong2]|nr:modification methylase [Microcystis phage vB_MweS-yong2]
MGRVKDSGGVRDSKGAKGAVSARGLFRAAGKRTRPARDETGALHEGGLPRQRDDYYATHQPEPLEALLRAEAPRLRLFPLLWEPAAGCGAMVRQLSQAGFPVVASDKVDRGCGAQIRDFLAFDRAPAPAIVTNPPFNLCSWRDGRGIWIEHAIGRLGVDYMALLLPWTWPAAAGLGPLWAAHPPARVHLMRWKIDFTGQGSPPSNHAWFVWDGAQPGGRRDPTQLLMLDRDAAP